MDQEEATIVADPSENRNEHEYTVYKRRWFMLAIFSVSSGVNGFQWIQYSIIANVIVKYYNISSSFVDWTAMIFYVTYVLFIFPACLFIDRKGLRWTTILAALGNCVGMWLKAVSVSPDLFWLSFIGQTITSIAAVFIVSIPPRLAVVWFGPDQVSSACSIGVFGNQFGVAMGFLVPPIVVKLHENLADTGSELSLLSYSMAGFSTIVLVIVLIFFKDKPPTHPSAAAAHSDELGQNSTSSFIRSIKNLSTNVPFILLNLAYGINGSIYYAISTLLNQIILTYYPGSEEDAGRIGVVIIVAGLIGAVFFGVVLDWSRKFKETTLAIYICSLLALIVYTFTLEKGIMIVYIVSGVLGFFMTGLLPVGFELSSEITYPEPEATSSGILNAVTQAIGVGFTPLYSWLFFTYGDLWANGTMCVLLVIGFIFACLIRSEMHRQNAQNIGIVQGVDNPAVEKS